MRIFLISGISGSGKSTLLNLIAGFDVPSEGSIFFNARPLDIFSALEKEQYAQQVIGFLFQKPYLIKELSVIENIMMPQLVGLQSYEQAHAHAMACMGDRTGFSVKSDTRGALCIRRVEG